MRLIKSNYFHRTWGEVFRNADFLTRWKTTSPTTSTTWLVATTYYTQGNKIQKCSQSMIVDRDGEGGRRRTPPIHQNQRNQTEKWEEKGGKNGKEKGKGKKKTTATTTNRNNKHITATTTTIYCFTTTTPNTPNATTTTTTQPINKHIHYLKTQ